MTLLPLGLSDETRYRQPHSTEDDRSSGYRTRTKRSEPSEDGAEAKNLPSILHDKKLKFETEKFAQPESRRVRQRTGENSVRV